jgi:uroporphyrinogen-III synthase
MNVLITRAEHQAQPLIKSVQQKGWNPLLFPTLTIKKTKASPINNNTTYIIFISANAVDYGHHLLQNCQAKIVAIGQATAKKLQQKNIKVDFYPQTNPSSETLLAMREMQNLNGENIVIIRGIGGQETLKNELSKNNTVIYKEVYERIIATPTPQHLKNIALFLKQDKGIIFLGSVENTTALLSLVKDKRIFNFEIIVISERIKNQALKLGFKNINLRDRASQI